MMSLFTRSKPHERSGYFLSSNQLIPTRPPFTTGGIPVTPETAATKVPLLAGVNLVADMPGILGVAAYSGHGGARRQVKMPKNVADPEAGGYGLADFSYKYLYSRILRGNVFLRVDDVDSGGRPQVVTILHPDDVSVRRNPKTGMWEFTTTSTGGKTMLPFPHQAKGGIIHRRAFPQPGQALGLSVIANHARTLGLSLAAEQFGSDFFADGAHPSGILSTEQAITEDQAKTIKQRFVNAIRGSREPAVLGAGVQYTPIQIKPNESQFLDIQKFTAAEQCRMIGPGVAEMLGYETGGNLTYQNVQSRSLHLLIYTIDKWLKDLERCLSHMFVPGPQSIEFDRNAILRMTPDTRWKVHETKLGTAAMVINEIRAEEGLGPVPWGNEPYLPAFGDTGTAAAEKLQLDAEEELGFDMPAPPKIGGTTSK